MQIICNHICHDLHIVVSRQAMRCEKIDALLPVESIHTFDVLWRFDKGIRLATILTSNLANTFTVAYNTNTQSFDVFTQQMNAHTVSASLLYTVVMD